MDEVEAVNTSPITDVEASGGVQRPAERFSDSRLLLSSDKKRKADMGH